MHGPIRVAMIIQAYYPHIGGAEQQLAALTPLLKAQGIEVSILTRRYPGLVPFETIDEVPIYRLPIPGPKSVASLSFALSALPILKRLRPHVIHAHELLSPTTTAVMAKRLFNIPVVAKVLRGGTLGDLAKLKSRFTGPRRMAVFQRYVDSFIAISHEIETELDEMGVPSAQRRFIPNGVDTVKFAPVKSVKKEALRARLALPSGPIAIFTGRLVAEKRVDLLIDIWPTVRAMHPEASLLILGAGEQEEILKQRASEGVHFLGPIDHVAPYLQTADLFVLPSSTEGLSNALLEAMSSGLPVVATQVGGAPDLIQHGRNGWLIPPEQPQKLVEAIVTLFNEITRLKVIGKEARAKVIKEYNLPLVAKRLRKLYEQLC